MGKIRERLRQAIEQQHRLERARPPGAGGAGGVAVEAAFRPVREAAEQLQVELETVPGLRIAIEPEAVSISLHDRHLWFGYDAAERLFVGSETDTRWMEGGLREDSHRWPTAEACIEAMIQASARYVALARSIARFGTP